MGKKDDERRRREIEEEMFGPKTPTTCWACGRQLPSSGRCTCGH